jgi:hypothetical protein
MAAFTHVRLTPDAVVPLNESSMYCDLLNSAFSEVDWWRIAGELLQDVTSWHNEEDFDE